METNTPNAAEGGVKAKGWVFISMLLAVIGLGVSLYSINHHVEVHKSGQTDAACNINATFSCDDAALSEYSEVLEAPLGVWGAGYFVALIIVLLYGTFSKKQKKEHLQAYGLYVVIGVFVSLVLLGISLFSLGTVCPVCVGVYVVCFALGGILWTSRSQVSPDWDLNGLTSGSMTGLLAITGVYLLYSAVNPLTHRSHPDHPANNGAADMAQIPQYSEKTYDIPIARSAYAGLGEDFRKGSDDAPVVIVEFADFQCPACKAVSMVLDQIVKENPNRVQVVFRNYPLDNKCNNNIQGDFHAHACMAARLARCAGQYGKFWQYHNKVFDNQSSLSSEKLEQFAADLGLSAAEIKVCKESADMLAKIQEDVSLGEKLGVTGTPSVYINGKKYLGRLSLQDLRRNVELLVN